jgi:hypothetical protein
MNDSWHVTWYFQEWLTSLSPAETNQILSGQWSVSVYSTFNVPMLGGQIEPIDKDGDGIPDYRDQCPNTPQGAIVDSHGCSLDQLVPCTGNWRSHAQYVAAVRRVSNDFLAQRLITADQRAQIIQAAITSDCPFDDDHDGVPNGFDQCSATATNALVDAHGCSIDQLVPCDANWPNHTRYVMAVLQQTLRLQREGRLTQAQVNAILRAASRSNCGNPQPISVRTRVSIH